MVTVVGVAGTMLVSGILPTLASAAVGDQVTGSIWGDIDSNGAFDTYESGLAGIEVKAYDSAGNAAGPVTTDANGAYALPVTSDAARWRIEANLPDTPQWASWRDSVVGAGNGSSVQFVDVPGGASGVDFSFQLPNSYVDPDPGVYIPIQRMGRYNGGNAAGAAGGVQPWVATGNYATSPPLTWMVTQGEVGATQGSAWQNPTDVGGVGRLFVSAYLKTGAGLGPAGLGGIYEVTPDDGTMTSPTAGANTLVDLAACGIDVGTSGREAATAAGTDNDGYYFSTDPDQAFGRIGKNGLGAMTLNADQTKLFVVNLFSRSVIEVPLGAPGQPVACGGVVEHDLSGTFPAGSGLQPFGITLNPQNGDLYISAVKTGQGATAGATGALVYRFSESAPTTLTKVLDQGFGSFGLGGEAAGFLPWDDNPQSAWLNGESWSAMRYMATDIAFNGDDLILGFRNRFMNQSGYNFIVGGLTPGIGHVSFGGMTVRASTSDGGANYAVSQVINDTWADGNLIQQPSNSLGTLTVNPVRSDGLLVTGINAGQSVQSNGVRRFTLAGAGTGVGTTNIATTAANPLGKAAGLGDVAQLAEAAPIEIGNYVWIDANSDGIQDPDEAPVAGATVNLYTVDGSGTRTLVSTTITGPNGEYYFSSTDPNYPLKTNTDYVVGVDNPADYADGGPLFNYSPTVADTGDTGSVDPDRNDSDGVVEGEGTVPYAAITTGGPGENDHTIDFGFSNVSYEFTKNTVSGPTPSAADDGTWTISYELVAENTGRADGSYTLTDNLNGYGAGIEVVGAEIVSGPPEANGLVNAAWDGITNLDIVTGEVPIAGESTVDNSTAHVYTVNVTVRLAADAATGEVTADPAQLACTPDATDIATTTGLYNTATFVPSNQTEITDDECADLPLVTLDKTVSVEPHVVETGVFEVVYGLAVTNETATATEYDLVDQLRFGAGVDIVAGSVTVANTAPGGITTDPSYDGIDSTTIVTNTPIAGNATHSYTVTVRFTVDLPDPAAQPDPSDCSLVTGEGEDGTGLFNDASSSFNGYPDGDTECREVGQVTHTKSLVSATPVGDGQWEVVYGIQVRNKGAGTTTYDLADELHFASGITVASATVTSTPSGVTPVAGWDGAAQPLVAQGASILGTNDQGYAPHEYVLTVVADVPLDLGGVVAGVDPAACGTGDAVDAANRALHNVSTVTDASGIEEDDDACAPLPSISVVKTIDEGPVANGDGTWTITYGIVASNTGAVAGVYNAVDKLFYGGQVVVESAQVTALDGLTVSNTWTGLGAEGDAANIIAADVSLPAQTEHTYQVEVVVSLDAAGATEALACPEPGSGEAGGLANSASIEHNGLTDEASVCASLPQIAVTKTVTGEPAPVEGEPGVYAITYTLTVANTGTGAGEYDLADALRLGEGVDVVDGSVAVANTAPGDIETDAAFDGVDSTTIVTGAAIAGSATHTYTVTAQYTVDLASVETPATASDCSTAEGELGTGLNNSTTVTWNGTDGSDQECREVGEPALDKALVSANPIGEGQWEVVYDLTVTNLGVGATTYDLDDDLRFDPTVTVDSATIDAAPAGVVLTEGWDGVEATRVATGVALPGVDDEGYAPHVYTVRVIANVPLSFDEGDIEGAGPVCTDPAGENELEQGLNNLAFVTTDAGETIDDTDCANLPDISVAKTVSAGPVANGDGTWTVTYDVVATNDGGADGTYTIDDQLRFGAGVVIASAGVITTPEGVTASETWTGQGPAGDAANVIAADVVLPAQGEHLYQVQVVVSLDQETVTPETLVCPEPGSGEAGGLANTTSIVHNNLTGTDEACVSLPDIDVTKDVTVEPAAVEGEPGVYEVTYALTVTNSGAGEGTYDLDDALRLGAGVTVEGAPVVTTDAEGAVPSTTYDGVDDVRIVAAQAIAGAADGQPTVHTYTVVVRYSVDLASVEAPTTVSDCSTDEGSWALASATPRPSCGTATRVRTRSAVRSASPPSTRCWSRPTRSGTVSGRSSTTSR